MERNPWHARFSDHFQGEDAFGTRSAVVSSFNWLLKTLCDVCNTQERAALDWVHHTLRYSSHMCTISAVAVEKSRRQWHTLDMTRKRVATECTWTYQYQIGMAVHVPWYGPVARRRLYWKRTRRNENGSGGAAFCGYGRLGLYCRVWAPVTVSKKNLAHQS